LANAPLRRNHLQQKQRDETRLRIAEAALRVFFARGYVNSSIEHILQDAKVSRAAFYSHFDGKLAVVSFLADAYQPEWRPIFDYLVMLKAPDMDSLSHWARQYLQHQQDRIELCTLLTQVTLLENALYQKISGQREALIHSLAKNHPVFAACLTDEALHVEAHILLSSLNQICFDAARHLSPERDEVVVRILARQMLEFLRRPLGK
jgi:AcrR family transcriptional regulator